MNNLLYDELVCLMLQCVAACLCELQCVAVCCKCVTSVLQMCCTWVLQVSCKCVASVLQCAAVCCSVLQMLQRWVVDNGAASVLQVCCSVM